MKKKSATALVSLLALTIMAASQANAADCEPNANILTVNPGNLTVAVFHNPPSVVVSDGQITGLQVAVANSVAKEVCLTVQPMVIDPPAGIQAVISGKADVAIGAWTITEERRQVLGITKPTFKDPLTILSRDGVDSFSDLEGKKVGSVIGFAHNPYTEQIFGGDLSLYPSKLAVLQDLRAGRIEATFYSYIAPTYDKAMGLGDFTDIEIRIAQPDERVPSSLMPPITGLLYTKGNDALGAALDAEIDRMHAEGEFKQLLTEAGLDGSLADVGDRR